MTLKNYHIRVSGNTENLIQYIKSNYSPPNCGKISGSTIRVTVDLPNEDAFIQDMAARGVQSFYIEDTFIDLSVYRKDALDNRVMFQMTRNVPMTLSVAYTDVIPTYNGMPIPLDTTGYKKMGMVLLWNKNGGTGTHTVKLTECNANGVISNPEKILREFPIVTGGYLADFSYTIPANFIDYLGFVKLQAKGTSIESPIFDGIWLYMIRR